MSSHPPDESPGNQPPGKPVVPGSDDRLIDAPSLPLWTGHVSAPEDAPTVPLVPPPAPVFEPSEAITAPAHAGATEAAEHGPPTGGFPADAAALYTPTVAPQREPQGEPQDRKEEASMATEDPRELARRLAEEAKRRLREVPPAPGAAPAMNGAAEPARPLAERATPNGGRPMSAREALEAARDAERREPAGVAQAEVPPSDRLAFEPEAPIPPTPPPHRASPQPAPIVAAAQRSAAVARPASANRAEPVSFSIAQFGEIVSQVFPGASPHEGLPVLNTDMFCTLWRSHRVRALHERDFGLAAAASALIDASERLPEGALAAGEVTIGGDTWAVWVDLSRQVVLAAARPAAIYLAG
jgi:hypothetical protein